MPAIFAFQRQELLRVSTNGLRRRCGTLTALCATPRRQQMKRTLLALALGAMTMLGACGIAPPEVEEGPNALRIDHTRVYLPWQTNVDAPSGSECSVYNGTSNCCTAPDGKVYLCDKTNKNCEVDDAGLCG
jgi:hypothetical protein